MAPLLSTSAEIATRERRLLDRLLGLYNEQKRIYGEVLEISRRQRHTRFRHGATGVIKRLLCRGSAAKQRFNFSKPLGSRRYRSGSDARCGNRAGFINIQYNGDTHSGKG